MRSIVNETPARHRDPTGAEAVDLIAASQAVRPRRRGGSRLRARRSSTRLRWAGPCDGDLMIDGKYTGEVAFYCYGEGKAQATRELSAALRGYLLEHCRVPD